MEHSEEQSNIRPCSPQSTSETSDRSVDPNGMFPLMCSQGDKEKVIFITFCVMLHIENTIRCKLRYHFQVKRGRLEKLRKKSEEYESPEETEKKSGIIYFQSLPPLFTVSKMRDEMSKLGEVGRIYLQAEKRRNSMGKVRKRFVEGWVEFKDKRLAKRIAASLNATPVGGKRRSASRETLWTMKYLSGFKWTHLKEQVAYEQKVEQQRMRAEISQVKRQANFFAEQVEKGKQLKKLEEKVLKKGGEWDKFQRQVQQRSVVKKRKAKETESPSSEDLMKMIFTDAD
ncbi:unnamed protein product [Anisakis simplex]|uniref:Activator of basal transcription 1 n=1 Tax=Anisakis simplex TaxID=6269 RepID=A0A0M3JV44_ANISI|nr:unnamed protein product [Anisakis simplex]